MKHMHILVPDDLYESLREKAFHAKTSMSKIIVARLVESIPNVHKTEVPEFIKKEPLINSATKAQLKKESFYPSRPRGEMNPADYI